MKKSLIALAALAATGIASAQSSVTLFGIVDATVQNIKGDGNGSVTRLTNSGYNSSRLGFRGTEDLGGGLSASFWLEAAIANDDGTGGASSSTNQPIATTVAAVRSGTQGLTFARRSTVSLAGGFGEIRLGRDYVPAFWNTTVFDPFGTNGVGNANNITLALANLTNVAGNSAATATAPAINSNALGQGAGAGVQTQVRASNSIGYFLPAKLGGIYGQVMYAMGENASNVGATKDNGNHIGARVGYAAGPLNVAVGYGKTDYNAIGTQFVPGDYKMTNIGASYKLGFGTLMGQYNQERLAEYKHNSWLLGASVPMGAGEIRASYIAGEADSATANGVVKGTQVSVGYVHNLSKRTAVYTTYSQISNKGTLAGYNNGRAATTADGDTSGFDLGIRHSF